MNSADTVSLTCSPPGEQAPWASVRTQSESQRLQHFKLLIKAQKLQVLMGPSYSKFLPVGFPWDLAAVLICQAVCTGVCGLTAGYQPC